MRAIETCSPAMTGLRYSLIPQCGYPCSGAVIRTWFSRFVLASVGFGSDLPRAGLSASGFKASEESSARDLRTCFVFIHGGLMFELSKCLFGLRLERQASSANCQFIQPLKN